MKIDEDLFAPFDEREPVDDGDDFEPEEGEESGVEFYAPGDRRKMKLSLYMAS
mgnify:CR=1 FL=1